MILKVSLEFSGRNVEGNYRRCVEIVSGTLIAHPGAAVARSPIRDIRVGVVVSGDPDWTAAGFPLIARRPGLASRLSWSRNGISSPLLFSGFRIKSGDESTNSKLTSRRADHHLASRNKRRKRNVVAGRIIGDGSGPHFTPGFCIERHDH